MKETSRHFFKIYFYWTINEYYKIKASTVYVSFFSLTDLHTHVGGSFYTSCMTRSLMWYWPFYTSCLRDQPLIGLYAFIVLHILTFLLVSMIDIFWLISSTIRSVASLHFKCVKIRFSLELILLVWCLIHMCDTLPKAILFDLNESEWHIEGTCSYRCYIAMTSSVFATKLMKSERWAAANRMSQCERWTWWTWPRDACSALSPGLNNDGAFADAGVVLLLWNLKHLIKL